MRNVKILFLCLALLSAGLLLGVTRISTPPSIKEIAAKTSKNIQRELSVIDEEASRILIGNSDERWATLSHSFYRVKNNTVTQWNQNEFLPDLEWIEGDFSVKLLKLPAGDFLIKKWPGTAGEFLVAVVPLHVDYKISNRYLAPTWNPRIFNTSDIAITDLTSGRGEPVYLSPGKVIFSMVLLSTSPEIYSLRNIFLVTLASVSTVSLLIFFFCWFLELHRRRKYEKALLLISASLIGIRLAMLLFNLPQAFTNSSVFDPVSFASSVYNPSLGDLLLNSVVVIAIIVYVFLYYSKFKSILWIHQRSENVKLISGAFFLLAAIFSFLFPFLFIETISNNSAIALDITQSLSFDALRILAYFSLLMGSISGFLGAHVFFRIALSLTGSRVRLFMAYTLALSVFCIYFLSAGRDYRITVLVATSYFVILFFTKLYKDASRITFRSSFYFFLIALAFSVQASFSLKRFVEESQRKSQLRFGNNFLVDRDILGEYLLHESSIQIANDPLIQSRLANPFLGRSIIRDKIKQVLLSSYFDRYDVQVYLYDARGKALDNLTDGDFASYIKLQTTASETEYKGLYFAKNDDLQSTKRYLTVIPVNYRSVVGGIVVLDLSLKRVIPQNVYPELLLDNRFSQYAQSKYFSYAFLAKQRILSSFGNFNYEKDFRASFLDNASLYSSGVREGGFIHMGIVDESGRTAVISAPAYSWFFLLTNIAFFFVLGLLLLFFLLAGYGMIAAIKGEHLNYSARIQLYIHMAFLIPLVAVSIATLSLTARSAQEQLNDEFSEKSKLLGERIVTSLDAAQRDEVEQNGEVENQLSDLSRLMNLDAALYDTSGYLIASTQPLIIENQLITRLMNREAWTKIVQDRERNYISNERIGLLQYNASYVAIKSPQSGKLIGIICLPFFDSASSLERNQTTVFANIIDIFFVVFVLFSFFSFFAADGLTFPLRFITRTLRRTTLVGDNKPLTWKANDEIGMMVNEYNRMVSNLEASKIELARSQKESAWREIAKQVAHEINNPLTPMKLTLQQMDRNLIAGDLTSEKTSRSIRTLLEQVDILNEIAASFSAFARMPAPMLHRVELVSLLKKVADLHKHEKSGVVHVVIEDEPLYALGDTQLLNRIFSNLILNALQSGKDGSAVQVKITAKGDDANCVISFADNGVGISKALREKIFLPHFTTKKTGSGIGLAIARQGIEQSGGDIWFESVEGAGTTFYITLPRVK